MELQEYLRKNLRKHNLWQKGKVQQCSTKEKSQALE